MWSYKDEILIKFGDPREVLDTPKGKEYRYNCPFCLDNRGDEDTKGHLFVNETKGIYHCYRCGASGRLLHEDIKGYKRLTLVDNKELLKDLIDIIEDNPVDQLDMVIPRKKAYEDKYARMYLVSRGFTDEMIDKYDLRVGSLFSNLLGYVVIPNQVKSLVMTDMYCARTYTGQTPKYRNPPSSKAASIVYNLHRIAQNPDRIIICEGAFDAMSAGSDAVALYGKECSEIKLSKILSKRPRQVVVNLDLDAKVKAYELAERIYKRDPSIKVKVLLIASNNYKDASDFLQAGRIDEYYELIEKQEYYNPIINNLNELVKIWEE